MVDKITTKNGLLYRDGELIPLPEADSVAIIFGYQHAEQLVKLLESKKGEKLKMEEEAKIHRKEIRKWLEVKYTPVEIAEMSMELARKTGELRTKEENKKSAMSQLKSEIDTLSARTNELSLKIVSGGENRNVKCEVRCNYENNRKTITRLDTMDFIFDGEIPEDEKQLEMDLENDENPPLDEQSLDTEPNDDTPPEETPSDAPETEESQEPGDPAEPEKESPLVFAQT